MMTKTHTGVLLLACISSVCAYQPSASLDRNFKLQKVLAKKQFQPMKSDDSASSKALAGAALGAAIFFATSTQPAFADTNNAAAQITLQQIPPTSIELNIGDLPVVGSLLSGTYSKVATGSISNPSVVISSPKDKVKAVSTAVSKGHLEFDVNGKLSTHVDVDIAAEKAGTANVVVQSNLIPKLPFKNSAVAGSATVSGKESNWNVVTNLGNGESYYYNTETGVTQYNKPSKI